MTIFDGVIWGGAALTTLGLAGIIWCIVTVTRAKRRKQDDAALRAAMKTVVVVNMAALGASVIGLLMVVMGIMLGR